MVTGTSNGGIENTNFVHTNENGRSEAAPPAGRRDPRILPSGTSLPMAEVGGVQGTSGRRPVDVNVMTRNMSIAKGFMDISLLSANANQLRHLINFGNDYTGTYYVILVGLVLSLVLQLSTGVILIMKERFNISLVEDKQQAELLNNITICLVFLILVINIFVSSLGVEVMHPPPHHAGHGGIQGSAQGGPPTSAPA